MQSKSTDSVAKTPVEVSQADLGRLQADFLEPFIPVAPGADNKALALTLERYNTDPRPKAQKVELLEAFLKENPNDSWAPSVSLGLGTYYHQKGRYSRALHQLEMAWTGLREAKEGQAKVLGDRALGEYARILAHLGMADKLKSLLASAEGRNLQGASTELVAMARQNLMSMEDSPTTSYLCGVSSLWHLGQLTSTWSDDSDKLLKTLSSTKRGTSLAQVSQMAEKLGLEYQAAYRESPESPILTPSILHYKVGHFTTLLDPVDGLYPMQDDSAGFGGVQLQVEATTVDEEGSGFFLVPAGPLPKGWRSVSSEEAQTVWGRGFTGLFFDILTTAADDIVAGVSSAFGAGPSPASSSAPTGSAGPAPAGGGGGGAGRCGGDEGMAIWDVHAMLVSLKISDTPTGLSPAAFAVPFQINYAQRDAGQPSLFTTSNLGPKWTNGWTSYITDLRNGAPFGEVHLYKAGGGTDPYWFPIGNTGTANPGFYNNSLLTDTGSGFTIEWPDGSRAEYFELIGSRYHLTSSTSPQGNTVNLSYDGLGRLVEIQDPVGRVMTIAHALGSDPLKITSVTDPFGRSATFTYTPDGHLESVTDVLGLVSSFQYGADDFINTLTTPYGTTTFTYADITTDPDLGTRRILEAVDAAGCKHRVEAAVGSTSVPGFPNQTPAGLPTFELPAPTGMPIVNANLQYRNTFYWAPNQLDAVPDYSKATNFHFMHLARVNLPTESSRLLQCIKGPLELRTWFAHDNEPSVFNPIGLGHLNQTTHVGSVLEDGTTQLTKYEYNSRGNVTKMTDPAGRVFNYTYAPNDIDLTSASTSGQTLFSATYDANHNITSITDSSGGISSFTYDGRGLLLTSTNPLGETTSNTYTGTGNLASVEAPLQAITTFGYDSAERVSSATDTEGYTVQATYDAFDRPVSVTYPDGTSDTLTYQNLDLVSTTDRIGRQTQMTYDPIRRLTSVIDGNGGTTTFGYSLEDRPISLTDPSGNTTGFQYDLQQRLIKKTYPGGATQTIDYETHSGRVKSITDALGRSKTYEYFIDNMLKSIEYSGNTPTVTFTQDTFLSRPLTMSDGQGVTIMTYHPVGSLGANAVASISGPYGDQASFSYDIAGRPVSRTVNGSIESVAYDALWRTTSATNLLDTFQMSYLGKTGQVTEVSSTQGPTTQFAYTPNSTDRRLAQIKNLRNGGTANISQFDYSYDAIGQITQMVKTHGDSNGGSDTTLTASKDSTLRAKKPHRNEGANPIMMLSHRPDIVNKSNNPIIDFDLSNTNLTGLTSAKLILTIKECDIPKRWGKNGRFIIAQPVDHPWVEGNGKRLKVPAGERTRGDGEGTTWFSPVDENISNKKADSAVEWNGARDFLGSLTAPPVNVTNGQTGPIEFDVTADLQAGFQNGWLLRKQDESKFGNIRFYSKEGAADAGNPDYAPRLVLEFGGQGASPSLAGLDDEGTIGQMLEVLESVWGIDTSSWDPEAESQPALAAAVTNSTETLDFRYDNLSQLIGVDINQTPHASYQFDPAGNMTSITLNGVTTNLTYNSRNQIETPGTNVFDAKGQTTDQDGRTFEWDEQGRVTAIVQGTHRSEFEYDGLSRRTAIVEIENGIVESRKLYWWLGGAIVCERDGLQAGFPITKRYFGQGVMDGTTKLYYTLDHLGTVQELTDESGEVVVDYRYSIYGERTKDSGTTDSDFGFAGLFHHAPSGLDLATYRLYDSRQRRFISRDPLGEAADYNLYRYANNNPVNFIDPDGLLVRNPYAIFSSGFVPAGNQGPYYNTQPPAKEDYPPLSNNFRGPYCAVEPPAKNPEYYTPAGRFTGPYYSGQPPAKEPKFTGPVGPRTGPYHTPPPGDGPYDPEKAKKGKPGTGLNGSKSGPGFNGGPAFGPGPNGIAAMPGPNGAEDAFGPGPNGITPESGPNGAGPFGPGPNGISITF